MDELRQARTVALKACSACSSGLLEYDRFCRWCGACQPEASSAMFKEAQGVQRSGAIQQPSIPITVVLSQAARAEVYRRISGPLVSAAVTGALGGSTEHQSRFIKRVTLALISIPIWLMIVLLSPLDAYAAVKNLAR